MTAEQPTGELSLRIERRRDANGGDGSSMATSQFHRGALRVLRPYYADDSGQATYTVINPGGAYFGGDTYHLTLDVADNAALRVTTQSATKVYKTPQGPAHQTMHITLGESARLDYVPDQLIVYENGSYRQDTTVDMQPSSSLTMSEIITPGWSPSGETFTYTELRMRTEIRVCSELFAIDQLRILPAEESVTGIGFMEGFTHIGQLIFVTRMVAQPAVADALAELVRTSDTHSGLTHAGRPLPLIDDAPVCLVIRSLAHSTEAIARLHEQATDIVKDA